MATSPQIQVTSHVGRDFLQNAAYFTTWPKIVWEYVSNSLDNARDGVPPIVAVELTSHYVRIADNGTGMSREDLSNFFTMHGENRLRRRGKRARGRFGTGKSAAFGLARCLRLDTAQSGLLNSVELHREAIEGAKDGQPFAVTDVTVNLPTDQDDGTTVEITDFIVRRVDVDKVIPYIERNLSRMHQNAHVTINGHVCRFEELPCIETLERFPPADVAEIIGSDAKLIIKVSPTPLDEDTRGIDILSHGIWHGSELAGLERKEKANYLFGEVDVPILEDGDWLVPAFDNTRNNTLNPQNPVVADLLGWLAKELESVRQELVEREQTRRRTELAQKLAREARKIAEVLNHDFQQQEIEFELTKRVSKRSGEQPVDEIVDVEGQLWPGDGDEPTPWVTTGSPHGDGHRGDQAGPGEVDRPGPTARPGESPGTRKATTEGQAKRRRGGFAIDYESATARNPRSRYEQDTKTIWINLDHPQISHVFEAGGSSVDTQQFREICYEVAGVEYSIALQYERLNRNEQYADEALDEVRNTINRITTRFAEVLYSV